MFNQVVIAMASHGYLGLEGGQFMIEFVVSQCAINVEDKALAKFANDEVTPTSLRDMSCKSLLLITTTIDNMDTVRSLISISLGRAKDIPLFTMTVCNRFSGLTCSSLLYQLATHVPWVLSVDVWQTLLLRRERKRLKITTLILKSWVCMYVTMLVHVVHSTPIILCSQLA